MMMRWAHVVVAESVEVTFAGFPLCERWSDRERKGSKS